jgi:hypothetical protein
MSNRLVREQPMLALTCPTCGAGLRNVPALRVPLLLHRTCPRCRDLWLLQIVPVAEDERMLYHAHVAVRIDA